MDLLEAAQTRFTIFEKLFWWGSKSLVTLTFKVGMNIYLFAESAWKIYWRQIMIGLKRRLLPELKRKIITKRGALFWITRYAEAFNIFEQSIVLICRILSLEKVIYQLLFIWPNWKKSIYMPSSTCIHNHFSVIKMS